ncbi:MAG: ABC transporter permease, partial [Actinomycetes bacterium]|nr:ABC transporter permease [Actinomycetes bacterium]
MTTSAPPAEVASANRRSGGSPLVRYLVTRFLLIFPTILILVSMVFVFMRATGDPITAALGGRLTPEQLAERIEAAGYNRPLWVQYVEYLGDIFTGNFGTTLSDNRPVTEILTTYGTATLELALFSLFVAILVGVPLGMVAGYFRDRTPDAILRVAAILFYATPVFFAGLMLKLVFSVWLGVLHVSGRASIRTELTLSKIDGATGIYIIDALRTGRWDLISDVLAHAVLPATALGLLTAGIFLRLVRTNVIGTLSMDYVDAARSRGVSEVRLVRK